jgi:hypothetical protein
MFLCWFYWQELDRRYGDRLQGRKMNLHAAFGEFLVDILGRQRPFDSGERTARKLLTIARQRLA